MIALLAAAGTAIAAATATPAPAPDLVLARYEIALAGLKEPRVFAFAYALEQTGARRIDQRHRVFRSGRDERDETVAVNGNRSAQPVVRIFRNRPYRYTVAALAPKPAQYTFAYAGPHKDGNHLDYVFDLVPKGAPAAFAFTRVIIDGMTFLPQSVTFATKEHAAGGIVTFGKTDRYWVARSATAEAEGPGGLTREQLTFSSWRFPKALPASTFAAPRPLPSLRPGLTTLP